MIDNRLQFTGAVTKAEYITTANHGLSKIEPLQIKINFADMFSNDKHIADKLNEVIEKVNLIMEGMKK